MRELIEFPEVWETVERLKLEATNKGWATGFSVGVSVGALLATIIYGYFFFTGGV